MLFSKDISPFPRIADVAALLAQLPKHSSCAFPWIRPKMSKIAQIHVSYLMSNLSALRYLWMLRQENEDKLRDGLTNIVSHHEARAKEFVDTLFSSIESRVSENATSRVLELMFVPEGVQETSELAKDSRNFHRALSTLMTTGASGHAPSTAVEKEIFAFQVKSSFQKTLVAPLLSSVKSTIRSEFFDVFLRDLNETTIGRLLPDLMEKILNAEAIAMSDRNADRTAFLYEAERKNVKAAYRAGYYEGRAAARNSEGAHTRSTSSRAEGVGGSDEIGRTVGSLELGALAVNFLDALPAATPHGQMSGYQPSQAHDEATPTIVVSNKGADPSRVSSFRRPSTASSSTVASGVHLGTHSVLGAAGSILGQVSRLQSFRRAVVSTSSSPLGGASMPGNGNGGGSGVVGSYDVPAAIRREEALWRANDALHSLLKRRCEEETQRVEHAIEHTTAKLKARVKVLEDEAAAAKTAAAAAKASLLQVEDLNAMLIDQLAAGRAHEGRLAAEVAFYQRELASVGGYRKHTNIVDDAVRTLEVPSQEAHAATQRSLGSAKGAMLTHENRDRFDKARPLLHFELPSRVSMEQQEAILRQASAVRDVEDENASLREKIRRLEEELYSSRRRVLAETAVLRANERKRIEQLNTQFVLAKKRLMAAEGVIQTLRAELTLAGSRGSGSQPSDTMKTREISEGAFLVEDTLRARLAMREKEIEILRQQLLVSKELRARIGDMDAHTPKVRGGQEGAEKNVTSDSPFTSAPEDSFLHVGPLFGAGLEATDSDEERTISDLRAEGDKCDVMGRAPSPRLACEEQIVSGNNSGKCGEGVEAAREQRELKKVGETTPTRKQKVLPAKSAEGSREGLGAVAKWIQLDLARKSFRRLSRVAPTTEAEGSRKEDGVHLLTERERPSPISSSPRPFSSSKHRETNSFRRLGDELLKVSSNCHMRHLSENLGEVLSTETKSNVKAHAAAPTDSPNALKTPSRNRPSTANRGSRQQGISVTSIGGISETTSLLRVTGTSAAGARANSPTVVPCPPRRVSGEALPPDDRPSLSPRNASSLSSRPPTRHASLRVETNNRDTLVDALLLEGRGRSRQLQAAIQSTANAGRRPLSASARSGQFR